MTKNNKDSATKNKGDEVVEVDGAKGGAMPKNVAVEVSKDEADQIEKIKRTLKSKKVMLRGSLNSSRSGLTSSKLPLIIATTTALVPEPP